MAVRRCRCGYTTEDVFADGCPLCLKPMALVNDAGPAVEPPRRPYRRAVPFLAVGLIVATLIGVLGLSGQFSQPFVPTGPPIAKADSSGRIRAGMHVGRAAAELDSLPLRGQPGKTLRDVLPRDSTASGVIICLNGRHQMRITFVDGYVTSIQEWTVRTPPDHWADVEFPE